MTSNDILRRLRWALNLPDVRVLEILRLAGRECDKEYLASIFLKEDQEGFQECSIELVRDFLDGFIVYKRGPSPNTEAKDSRPTVTNNYILRALRIAFSLKDDDIVEILAKDGVSVSKSEVNALFRNRGHQHYRACGDQFLRHFFSGLARWHPSSRSE